LVDGVAEAVGVAGFEFDHLVDALAGGVGDTGVQECLDLGPPRLDGGSEAVQFGDAGVGAPLVERPQPRRDLVARRAGAGQGE
jgi:hypothetical protein